MQLANLFKFSEENKKFAVNILTFLLIFGFVMLMQFAMHVEAKPFNFTTAAWTGLGGSFLMANLLNDQISALGIELKKRILPRRMLSSDQKRIISYKNKLQQGIKKSYYTKSQTQVIKSKILEYEDYIEWEISAEHKDKLAGIIDKLLTLQKTFVVIDKSGTTIENALLNLIAEYPLKLQGKVLKYAQELYIKINGSKKLGVDALKYHNSLKKIKPLYLVGPPGVGKTRFVKEFARVFGISIYQAEIDITKSETYRGDFGSNGDSVQYGVLINAITKAQSETKSSTVILFIDEIDKIFKENELNNSDFNDFNSWLHSILEAAVREIYSRTLHCDYNISNVIIMFAGNKKIGLDDNMKIKEEHKSLVDRIKYIEFLRLSQESKLSIANKYFKDKMDTYKLVVSEHDKVIIKLLVDNNHLPGVRKLLHTVDSYINFLVSQKVLNNWQTKPNEYKMPKAGWLEAKHKNEILSKAKQHKDNQDKVKLKKSYSSPDLLKVL